MAHLSMTSGLVLVSLRRYNLEDILPLAGMPVQSPSGMAPGPVGGADCTTALFGMSDCLGYVQVGSNDTKPDPACCPELSGLLKNQPTCLCLLLGDTASTFGIQIDLSKALQLPSACALQTPSLAMCPAAPGGAPASSEAPTFSPGGVTPGPVAASPGSATNDNGASSIGAFGLALFVALTFSSSMTSF